MKTRQSDKQQINQFKQLVSQSINQLIQEIKLSQHNLLPLRNSKLTRKRPINDVTLASKQRKQKFAPSTCHSTIFFNNPQLLWVREVSSW